MPHRFVRLTVGSCPPLQVLVDNLQQYLSVRGRLNNYEEYESSEADPSMPVISISQLEKTLNICPPPNAGLVPVRRGLSGIFAFKQLKKLG